MELHMMDMSEILSGRKPREDQPRPLHAAQIMEINEHYQRYARPCPHKPGDLVMAQASSGVVNPSEPHIVTEVLADRMYDWPVGSVPGQGVWGCSRTMRVACIQNNGEIGEYWVDHAYFVPYVAPPGDKSRS